MVDYMPIQRKEGELIHVAFLQFVLNHYQQFVCLGINFDDYPDGFVFNEGFPHVKVELVGKLSEQGMINMNRIQQSLFENGWDYERYPDPEILLLTDMKKKSGQIILKS